jgi:hypothetical protein
MPKFAQEREIKYTLLSHHVLSPKLVVQHAQIPCSPAWRILPGSTLQENISRHRLDQSFFFNPSSWVMKPVTAARSFGVGSWRMGPGWWPHDVAALSAFCGGLEND